VDENAMFDLLGLKTKVNVREIKLGPIVAPTDYALHDIKGAHIVVMIRLQRSHILHGMKESQIWIYGPLILICLGLKRL
jgi:hypothetical protein